MTEQQRPESVDGYITWLRGGPLSLDLSMGYETYYAAVAASLERSWESSEFWAKVGSSLSSWHDGYRVSHDDLPLMSDQTVPSLAIKPYRSFLDKTYRRNVAENNGWPQPPPRGWTTHPQWFQWIGDVVRTTLTTDYLDGVEYLTQRCVEAANELGLQSRVFWEARDSGYYASHFYVTKEVELPEWGRPGTVQCKSKLEIQITTRLKETLRSLTHPYYESRRGRPAPSRPWQWNYRSDEFIANYLGHTLHFLEGVMIEVRERSPHDTEPRG
jgi:hypothetical protein